MEYLGVLSNLTTLLCPSFHNFYWDVVPHYILLMMFSWCRLSSEVHPSLIRQNIQTIIFCHFNNSDLVRCSQAGKLLSVSSTCNRPNSLIFVLSYNRTCSVGGDTLLPASASIFKSFFFCAFFCGFYVCTPPKHINCRTHNPSALWKV